MSQRELHAARMIARLRALQTATRQRAAARAAIARRAVPASIENTAGAARALHRV